MMTGVEQRKKLKWNLVLSVGEAGGTEQLEMIPVEPLQALLSTGLETPANIKEKFFHDPKTNYL